MTFSCLGWPAANQKSNMCLGSLQLLQASLKSVALVQVMAVSGLAGRFCRRPSSAAPRRGSHCLPLPKLPMRHQLWAMGRAMGRHPLFHQREENQCPDSSCCTKTHQRITTHQLLHMFMQDAALLSKSAKSAVTEVMARVSPGI